MAPRFSRYGISDLSSQLRAALEQFPGVKLIPFGWVAFFIFLYILLIGPGDYFFLKKVLKRMELTWITFPTIVLTVSLVAYYAAYVLKGNDLLVNKVDLVDIDQEAGIARGNTWMSLFSPQNRDYTIHAIPTPAGPGRFRPPAAASGGEAPRAAGGNRSRDELVQRSRRSVRRNGKLEPPVQLQRQRLRLPTRRGSRIPGKRPHPDLEHQVHHRAVVRSRRAAGRIRPRARLGTDRLAGTITNRQSIPLEDAMLAYGKEVYLLGNLSPGRRSASSWPAIAICRAT